MPFVHASFPADSSPPPPEPPRDRVEAAARAICEALASDQWGRANGEQRVVELRRAWWGFPIDGEQHKVDTNAFRWAARLMAGAGLVSVLKYRSVPPSPDNKGDEIDILWVRWQLRQEPDQQPPPPSVWLRSTPELWSRWRAGSPILGTAKTARTHPSAASTPTPAGAPPRPRWDMEARTLFYGVRELKRYSRHPARNQTTVLAAFEEAGWPSSIPLPLRKDQLGSTVRALNKAVGSGAPIRFRCDGTGSAIRWEVTPS